MLIVRNPFNGGEIARLELADAAAIDTAISQAHDAFGKARLTKPFERAELLSKVGHALRSRRDEFAKTILEEAGKPIVLAEAEVDRAIVTFTAAAEEARHRPQGESLDLEGFATGKGYVGLVKRFPIGVIYGMTPFNFPLNLVAHKVAPAIASGNSIVIKPSPRTPLSALKLAELFREAGAIDGIMQVVVCPNELATRPADDPRVKHVSFTGSAPIGWKLKEQVKGNRRVTLELGGNAPLIVHDDANLDEAAVAAAAGAYSYAGQSCISVQRILIQKSIYHPFKEKLVQQIREKIKSGDPTDRSVLVGPMIDVAALQRVLQMIEDAKRNGAKVILGGRANGPCIEPTLIENADLRSQICTTEIFAPVATLHAYDSFEDALRIANDSEYGLQAGVFTRDISRAWQAFEALETGGVLINQAPTWRHDIMPYGGVKESGFGREGIKSAMQEMTEPRTLVVRMS